MPISSGGVSKRAKRAVLLDHLNKLAKRLLQTPDAATAAAIERRVPQEGRIAFEHLFLRDAGRAVAFEINEIVAELRHIP